MKKHMKKKLQKKIGVPAEFLQIFFQFPACFHQSIQISNKPLSIYILKRNGLLGPCSTFFLQYI